MILSHVFILHSGYLSLGCSHTVAFMRAVHHGCKDPNGQLPHIPKSDPIWEAIHDGWWWHVISSQVEDAIPKLASFVQMALNASNSIHKAINELEVACQAATIFQQTQSLDQAMITISQGDLQCRSSLKAIGHYVTMYAGGHGFPLLKFLANFGTIFNATLLLGQEFMGALAHHNFNHPTCIFPMRTAIWATMLTTSKSMEGYARLLSKSDLPKIGSPLSRATQAETILLDAWQIVQASIGSPATWTGEDAKTEDKAKHGYKCFGKLCIRIIHFMAKKKNTHESKEYKTMEEITLQFTKDLQAQDQTDDQKSAEEQPSSSRQQVQDAISASPSTIALLQNNHMELHGMLLGNFQNQGFSLLLSYFNIHN